MPDMAACNIIRPKASYFTREGTRIPEQSAVVSYHSVEFTNDSDEISRVKFAG